VDHSLRIDKRIFMSTALVHEDVPLRRDDSEEESWDVVFDPLSFGYLEQQRRDLKFFPSRQRLSVNDVSGCT
jgi:hypothetical protein